MDSNSNSIGSFIAVLRKEANLTQSQLAKKLNVTDKAISRWENGLNLPDIEAIQKLCRIFDVSIEEMYSGKRIDSIFVMKKRKIKRNLIRSLMIIILLSLVLLLIYFINSFNSIKFYKLHVQDNKYELNNSYILVNKSNTIFNFGGFIFSDEVDFSDLYMEIYFDDNVLYSGIYKNVYLEGVYKIDVNNLYIKLMSLNNDYMESLKIDSSLRYSNNLFFELENNNKKEDNKISKNYNELIDLLNEFDFSKKTDTIYYKSDDNSTIYVNIVSKVYNKVTERSNSKEVISFYSNSDYIDYQFIDLNSKSKNVVEEFYYVIEKDLYKCITGRCNNYDEVMEWLEDDLKVIKLLRK